MLRGQLGVASAAQSVSPTRDQRTKLLSPPSQGNWGFLQAESPAGTVVRSPVPLVQAYDPVMCSSQGPGPPSGWRSCPPRSGEHGERCRKHLAHYRARQVAATITTVITVHFLRQESDALRCGIQRVWLSVSPGPRGSSHCSLRGAHLQVKGSVWELA